MTTHTLNRRDLLGTTASALAAFAALSGTAVFSASPAEATKADVCIANHRNLAKNLQVLTLDPNVGDAERAFALKTCRCIHCDVAITPLSGV